MISVSRSGEQEIYYFKGPMECRIYMFTFPEHLWGAPALPPSQS